MSHIKNKIKLILIVSAGLLAPAYMLLPATVQAAGTATFSLTPASGSFNVGDTLSVKVYEDSGSDVVNATEVKLTYPASLLTYQSTTTASVWDIAPTTSAAGGNITLDRAHCQADINGQCTNPLSGSQLIATINFTAAAAGQAAVNFANGTVLYRLSDNGAEALTMNGGNYTISAPVTPPPSGGGTTGSSSSSSSSAPKSTPKTTTHPATTGSTSPTSPSSTPASSTTPAISNVQIKNLSDNTATITWTTSVPATSEVDYGYDTHYGFTAVDNSLTKDHSVVLDPSYLTGGKVYHYVVKSVDADGKLITAQDASFKTLAASGNPAKNNSGNSNLWAVISALLVVGAAVVVGYSLYHHMRHPLAPVAIGTQGSMRGGTLINPAGKNNSPASSSQPDKTAIAVQNSDTPTKIIKPTSKK